MEQELTLELAISFEVLSVAIDVAADAPLAVQLANSEGQLAGEAKLVRLPADGSSLLAVQLDVAFTSGSDPEAGEVRMSGRIDVYAQLATSRLVVKYSLQGVQASDDQIKDMIGNYLVAALNSARASGKLISEDRPTIIARILYTGRAYWIGCSLLVALMMTLAVFSYF